MTRLRFRPDIEGLRGVAILLVVAYHVGMPGVSGGFVGVDVFFTLSGYLITQLLLQELDETGRVSLLAFYARRMRRLLPAAALAILGTLLLSVLVYPPSRVVDVAMEGAAAAASVSNLLFASQALDYFRDHAPSPLLHTWSLAVEEQFYLAWPLLVLLAAGRGADRARLGAVLALLTLVSAAFCWWWTIAERPVAFYGTPFRAWEFAVGGVVALLPTDRWRSTWIPSLATAASWSGMAAIVFAATTFTEMTPFPGVSAAIPAGGTALLLVAARVEGAANAGRLLAANGMQWLGRHSYGWYLWHWPLLVLAAAVVPGLGVFAKCAIAVMALLVAGVSLRLIEEPIRRGAVFHASPGRAVGGGVALVAMVAMLALGLRRFSEAVMAEPEQVAFANARRDWHPCRPVQSEVSEAHVCRLGAVEPTRTVALFGDSHATQWLPALEELATRNGWELLVLAKSACPSAHLTLRDPDLNREFRECGEWRAAALDTLRGRRPDLVILSNTSAYVTGGPYAGPRTEKSVAEWEAGLEATVAALAGWAGEVVLLADTPKAPSNVADCLTMAVWRGRDAGRCDFEASPGIHGEIAAAEARVAARTPGVRRIDLTDAVCRGGVCRVWEEGTVLYRDTNHLTAAGARRLTEELGKALEQGNREYMVGGIR